MLCLSYFTILGRFSATDCCRSIGPSKDAGVKHFDVSDTAYLLSNTGFFIVMAVGPMFLAPISETFGRRPVFLVSLVVYSVTFIPSSLVTLYPVWAVARAISGLGASVVNTMVPGSITDLYGPTQTARVMNYYILSLFAGQVSDWSPSERTAKLMFGPLVKSLLGGCARRRLTSGCGVRVIPREKKSSSDKLSTITGPRHRNRRWTIIYAALGMETRSTHLLHSSASTASRRKTLWSFCGCL